MTTAKNLGGTISKAENSTVLRPASLVMSQARAGAAYPNALSFSRNLLRKMCRENWRIEAVRVELDADGRGEALYRIDAGTQTFHFFAISDYFPPNQKIDRAFGINWDVSAAICQGEWTQAREARLRVEIPKQYDGRYDGDVLCFCRGNRSERIFDHVVERLAEGRQPDVGLLAGVGYLLRSTAFAGNGLFGMRPFEALGGDHALGATYEVQMLSAYMLRVFVFDLAETMARTRSGGAVALDRRLKRYLGVGNSAGLGLIPFVTNHPLVVDRWCTVHEQAFAQALARDPGEGDAAARFVACLDRACAYFAAEERDGNGIFADYAVLLGDLRATLAAARAVLANGDAANWHEVLARATPAAAHAETIELLHGIVLELYPDIVERHERSLQVEGGLTLEPDMQVQALHAILRRDYGWVLERRADEPCERFWYYPQESPFEPRRGVRGTEPGLEVATSMDVPLMAAVLDEALRGADPDAPVAELLAERPGLAAIVARVQSLQQAPYAELRVNSLTGAFRPFAACRFVLAFYGMEKYDPRLPRSTKGALMQGAPLHDELGRDEPGDWPFPLPPDLEAGSQRSQSVPPLRALEQPEISIKDLALPARRQDTRQDPSDLLPIFAQEHHKLLTRVALRAGLPGMAAEELADAALLSAALGRDRTKTVLDQLARLQLASPRLTAPDRLDAAGLPALAVLPRAIDLACVRAGTDAVAWMKVDNSTPCPLLFAAPIAAAARGLIVALADPANASIHLAGPGRAGVWIATLEGLVPAWAADQGASVLAAGGDGADCLARLIAPAEVPAEPAEPGRFYVACLRLPDEPAMVEQRVAARLQGLATDRVLTLASEALRDLRRDMVGQGVQFTREALLSLQSASLEALVPEAVEARVAIPA